jgi:alpha-tubulin suppressor-like RCC1 family protein
MRSRGHGQRGWMVAGGVLARRAGLALLDAGKRGRVRRLYVAVAIISAGLCMSSAAAAANVSAGESSTCALLSSGHVECWGENEAGQLGDGSSTGPETCSGLPCSRIPLEVSDITDATQVSAGGEFACALLSTGHVECWGRNKEGELGNGTTTNSDTPVEVSDVIDAAQVSAGDGQACALLSSGHVECWGENELGQLGDGTNTNSDTPVEVSDITDATQVSAGVDDTCALISGGQVMCWGSNKEGELGDGKPGREDIESGPETCSIAPWWTYSCSRVPVEVSDITDATQVSTGGEFACAVLSTGQVECWGEDRLGQLGIGTYTEFDDRPVETLDVTDAVQVSAGRDATCALLSSGHVECWGDNYYGELGDGKTGAAEASPVEVSDTIDATQVSAGDVFACALLSGGSVECWGHNLTGELGDGTTTNSDTPVEAPGLVMSACTTAVGGGVYKKVGKEGRLRLKDNLSTNLEASQQLIVRYRSGRVHFYLIKLDKATCTGEPGERDFQGEGAAAKDGERGFTLSFSIYEKEGGVFFQSKLMKGAEEVEVSGGQLRKSTEVIH